jgi:aldose 1-epimerase/LuxR family transcriptional regulator
MLNAFFEVFTTLGGIISLFTLVILEMKELEASLRAAHFHVPQDDQALTRAQTDALRLLSRGMRLKEIANALGISESAVKARLKSAVARMDARTPVQAASIASQRGLLK